MNNLKEKICDIINCHESLITLLISKDEVLLWYSNWITYKITPNEIIYIPDVINRSRINDKKNKDLLNRIIEASLFIQKKVFC